MLLTIAGLFVGKTVVAVRSDPSNVWTSAAKSVAASVLTPYTSMRLDRRFLHWLVVPSAVAVRRRKGEC